MRRSLVVSLVLASGLLAMPATGHAISADRLMVQEINKFRAANGVRAVRYSASLSRASRAYARRLMARGQFRHARNLRASSSFSGTGEVLERHTGTRARLRHALRAWINSPGHRAVLLHRRFRWAGAGFHKGIWNGRRSIIWVGRFGHR